jgi:hypothetical protein
MNPYVFIVGCPRSGTTLLRRICDAHSQLAIVREQHWLPRYWELRIGINPDGTVTPDLLDMLLSDKRFPALELAVEQVAHLIDRGPTPYSEFVTRLFDLHGDRRRKPFVGEKTPKYVRHLATLNELWPQARIVHLIRDGRDVSLSLLEWDRAERNVGRFPTWAEDPVTTTAIFWEWNVRQGREVGVMLGRERYYELTYEALVAHPELECRNLCSFLDLAYDPAMLRFHEGRTKSKPGLSPKKAWRPITPGLRTWREQMGPSDVARFEAAAGPLLDDLRYERANKRLSHGELAKAERLRQAFAKHARTRRQRVPVAWKGAAA